MQRSSGVTDKDVKEHRDRVLREILPKTLFNERLPMTVGELKYLLNDVPDDTIIEIAFHDTECGHTGASVGSVEYDAFNEVFIIEEDDE
jgi:hypothetical protein